MAVALFGGGDDLAVADDQVRADDDADVVDLQALAGMDAADLFDGVLGDDPETAVLVEVPLALVVADDDVLLPGILLAAPRPAVAGHDAGLVVLVPGGDGGVQGLGGVEDLEVVLAGVELLVGGRADVEHVVEPGEVAVRAIAAELRGEAVFLDRGAFRLGELADGLLAADVAEGDALVFVDEEDGALGGFDQFLDLVFAEVAVEPALLVQAVGLVDDQHVEGVGLGLDEAAGAGEHVGEAAAGDGTHQPGFVDLAWRGVLGHVLADQAKPGEVDQQVDRDHRLAGARAALDDQYTGMRLGG